MFQSLREVARARLHLVEQPHVLDSDHRLVGESLDQLNLLLSERVNLGTRQEHCADRVSVAQQRYAERGAKVPPSLRFDQSELRIGQNVGDVNRSAFQHGSCADRSAVKLQAKRQHVLQILGLKTVDREIFQTIALNARDVCLFRATQSCSRLDQSIEYLLQIEGRAADHLEHVGGGGLLLEGLSQLVEEARVLDRDDSLAGEVRDQLDLLIGEGTDLLPIDEDRADKLVLFQHRHGNQRPRTAEIGCRAPDL